MLMSLSESRLTREKDARLSLLASQCRLKEPNDHEYLNQPPAAARYLCGHCQVPRPVYVHATAHAAPMKGVSAIYLYRKPHTEIGVIWGCGFLFPPFGDSRDRDGYSQE